jgi:hypothetical protein
MSTTVPNSSISFSGLRNAWANVHLLQGGPFIVGPSSAPGFPNATDPGTSNISLSEFRNAQFTASGTPIRVPASGQISLLNHFLDASEEGYTFGNPGGK